MDGDKDETEESNLHYRVTLNSECLSKLRSGKSDLDVLYYYLIRKSRQVLSKWLKVS